MPNFADEGNERHAGRRQHEPRRGPMGIRPRPRALARSEAAPAQGTSRSSSTLSMAMTAPMAVRCSPSASRTRGGTNVLRSGPVTPEKRPPSPMSNNEAYGVRAGRAGSKGASLT